jgi:hypothetical protein
MFVLLPETVRYLVEPVIVTVVISLSSSSITTVLSPMFRSVPMSVCELD